MIPHAPLRARRSVPTKLTLHSEEGLILKDSMRSSNRVLDTSVSFQGSAIQFAPPVPERSPVSLGLVPMTPIPKLPKTSSTLVADNYEVPSAFAPLSPCVLLLDRFKPVLSPRSSSALAIFSETSEGEIDSMLSAGECKLCSMFCAEGPFS